MNRKGRSLRQPLRTSENLSRTMRERTSMLPVTITDLDAMTQYLDALLGPKRVSGLTPDEIQYLASLVHEPLPEAPDDEISRLLGHCEAQQLAQAQVRLAAIRREQLATRIRGDRSGRRATVHHTEDQGVTQHTFLEELSATAALIGQT